MEQIKTFVHFLYVRIFVDPTLNISYCHLDPVAPFMLLHTILMAREPQLKGPP